MTFAEFLPSIIHNDGKRIKQVLINLISNALKFTQKGGVFINISYSEVDHNLIFNVSDTGLGMTNEEVDQLFKEYTRIERHRKLNTNGIRIGRASCRERV